MSATIVSRTKNTFKVEIEISYSRTMLEGEENLQKNFNLVGCLSTSEVISQFDTDGSPIEIGNSKYYARSNKETKSFQTPYGEIVVERNVYQGSDGGRTYVALNMASRIVGTS